MTEAEATVRRYYELIDADEYEDLFDLFSDDVVYERPGASAIEGKSDLRTFYLEERPLSAGEHTVDDVIVDGDRVAVRGRFSGRQDGEEVSFGFADVHEFDDDGTIARRFTYTDRDAV